MKTGPDIAVLYASIILNCFLLYAAARVAVHYSQEKLMTRRDPSLVLPFTNQKKVQDMISLSDSKSNHNNGGNKEYFFSTLIANWTFLSAYNRPGDMAMVIGNSLLCFVLTFLPFVLLTVVKVPLSLFIFLPYFFTGVLAAFMAEVYFYYFFEWKIKPHLLLSTNDADTSEVEGDVELGKVGDKNSLCASSDGRRTGLHANTFVNKNTFYVLGAYLWRFFPDMMAVVFVVFLTTAGDLSYHPFQRTLEWTILPMMSIVYLIVATIQDDWARNNLSRWLLQTRLMNWFGYISYPMFLFQKSLLNWWAPKIAECINLNKFAFFIGGNPAFGADPNEATWFTNLNMGYRILLFIVLCCFCWLVQKYYQDMFVMWLFNKCKERDWAGCRRKLTQFWKF